jgi:hypothetical protein
MLVLCSNYLQYAYDQDPVVYCRSVSLFFYRAGSLRTDHPWLRNQLSPDRYAASLLESRRVCSVVTIVLFARSDRTVRLV